MLYNLLSADMEKQNVDKKAQAFSWRSKNVRKRTKTDEKGLQCKSTLIDSVCSNCTRLRYETNTICYSKRIITLP